MNQPKLCDFGSTEEKRQDADTSDDGIHRQERIAAHAFRVGKADVAQLDIDMREERDTRLAGEAHRATGQPRDLLGDAALGKIGRDQKGNRGNGNRNQPNQAQGKHDDALHASRCPSRRVAFPADNAPPSG